MARLLAIAVVCGLAVTASAASKRFKPAKLHAALFVEGRAWTYQITRTVETSAPSPDDDRWVIVDTKTETATTTCRIAEVWRFKRGVMSRLECDPAALDTVDKMIEGMWYADKKRLSTLDEMPPKGRAPRADDLRLRMDARPRAEQDQQELEEGTLFGEVRKDAGGWCRVSSWIAMGKSGSETLCYDAGGIRSGEDVLDDEEGVTIRATFTRQ